MTTGNDSAGLDWQEALARRIEEELGSIGDRAEAVEQARATLELEARCLERREEQLFDLYVDLPLPPDPPGVTAQEGVGDDVSAPLKSTRTGRAKGRRLRPFSRSRRASGLN